MEMQNQQPGFFQFKRYPSKTAGEGQKEFAWMYYNCPCGCGTAGALPLVQPLTEAHDNHTWGWDGNEQKPTLTPSIRRTIECKFHGHLQNGVWSACDDGPRLAANVYSAP